MLSVQTGGRFRMRIGEILLRDGVLTEDELTVGLLLQHGTRKLIGEVLINLDFATPHDIDSALTTQSNQAYA